MDSHSAHIGAEVLKVAKDNQIYLFTFPAHCTHLLQPLDVGLFKPLKTYWRDNMNQYMSNNPSDAPNRSNFHSILNPAFIKAFTKKNIENAFSKTGICPLNKDAISEEALRPSALTDSAPNPSASADTAPSSSASTNTASGNSTSNTELAVDNILVSPKAFKREKERSRKRDSSAKCLTPINDANNQEDRQPQPSTSGTQKTKKSKIEDDWECGLCEAFYSSDVKKRNGAKWIQCSYCLTPYHEICVSLDNTDVEEQLYYRCDRCLE